MTTNTVSTKTFNPVIFTLWIAIASIIMMFSGLTSAYIVKRNLPTWQTLVFPSIFLISTAVILLSSLSLYMADKFLKEEKIHSFQLSLLITLVLGIAFVVLQWEGFTRLWNEGITFKGASGGNQFLYVIAGLHLAHVIGGIIALSVSSIKSFVIKDIKRNSIKLAGIYWHFVDVLWIYLFIFFLIAK